MKRLLYNTIKIIIRIGLFFYTKQIKIVGAKNIPKKGAILFTANHPNGLIDPLIIASSVQRKIHFLVRANVFKKTVVATFFNWMGMMPVYRIRDGFNQLHKNNTIFEQCEQLLHNKKALLIFPEGSHANVRTIRTLSKGFTRIVFGTLAKHPEVKIYVIPVGITYQNPSHYPSKVALHIGSPIIANQFYKPKNLHTSTNTLKKEVLEQLKNLTTHINNDKNYNATLQKLNNAQVDFTEVKKINTQIKNNNFSTYKSSKTSYLKPIKWLIIINSFIPYIIWKKVEQKIDEIEFIDTFRFGINLVLVSIFYLLQTLIISFLFGKKTGVIYFLSSLILIGIYTKFSATNTKQN